MRKKGFKHSEETKQKMRKPHIGGVYIFTENRKAALKKVHAMTRSEEWKKRIGDANRGRHKGEPRIGYQQENHGQWKGDTASYCAIHNWVRRWYGTPKECSHCGTTKAKKFEWANKSGKYKRDINDYARLCTSCHRLQHSGKIEV